MRTPLLIIAVPFVLLAIFMNSPLRDSLGPSTSQVQAGDWRTVNPVSGRWRTPAEDRARAERRAAARERQQAAAPQSSTSLARTWAGRTRGRLDSPMQSIQEQLAPSGVSPSLSRRGDYRVFTYRFQDGSALEFTAVSAGDQRGLILYSVDIRD